jgi:hypothetical protein
MFNWIIKLNTNQKIIREGRSKQRFNNIAKNNLILQIKYL